VGRPRVYDEARVTTAVRLSPELRARLREAARDEGLSVNQLVVRVLDGHLRRRRRKASPARGER
jgi:predicted HicB family RNase H-like nuclease